MDIYLRVDINIVASVILGVILYMAVSWLDMRDLLNRSFVRVSVIIIIQLMIETLTCIINGRSGEWLVPVAFFLNLSLFVIAPFLALHGYLLIRNCIFFDRNMNKMWEIALRIPAYANLIVTLVSLKYRYIFYISDTNVYHRGTFFFISVAFTYVYMLLSLVLVWKNRRVITSREFIPLIIFVLLPSVGGLIQALFYKVLLMWSSVAFSLVILYVFLQERMVHLDDLTGAWTRGSFEYYIDNRLRGKNKHALGIIYCDVDDLKGINDRFGHLEGDQAIINTTRIINETIDKKDIVVRMGGDEFVIVIEQNSMPKLERILNQLEKAFLEYNRGSGKGYRLSCSFGADFYNLDKWDFEEFMKHIDGLMYENKRKKKRN